MLHQRTVTDAHCIENRRNYAFFHDTYLRSVRCVSIQRNTYYNSKTIGLGGKSQGMLLQSRQMAEKNIDVTLMMRTMGNDLRHRNVPN